MHVYGRNNLPCCVLKDSMRDHKAGTHSGTFWRAVPLQMELRENRPDILGIESERMLRSVEVYNRMI
jgi:hypothetical protein